MGCLPCGSQPTLLHIQSSEGPAQLQWATLTAVSTAAAWKGISMTAGIAGCFRLQLLLQADQVTVRAVHHQEFLGLQASLLHSGHHERASERIGLAHTRSSVLGHTTPAWCPAVSC